MTLRPDIVRALPALAGVLYFAMSALLHGRVVVAPITLMPLALVVAWVLGYEALFQARFIATVSDDRLTVRRFVRTRGIPLGRISGVRRVAVRTRAGVEPYILILGDRGRAILMLRAAKHPAADLASFLSRLSQIVDAGEAPVGLWQVYQRYGTWHDRWAMALTLVFVSLAVVWLVIGIAVSH